VWAITPPLSIYWCDICTAHDTGPAILRFSSVTSCKHRYSTSSGHGSVVKEAKKLSLRTRFVTSPSINQSCSNSPLPSTPFLLLDLSVIHHQTSLIRGTSIPNHLAWDANLNSPSPIQDEIPRSIICTSLVCSLLVISRLTCNLLLETLKSLLHHYNFRPILVIFKCD
jgi:hypothetical protein